MWKQLMCGCLAILTSGCASSSSSIESETNATVRVRGCPSSPPQLSGDRVRDVSIQYRRFRHSGKVTPTKSVGYRFEGKAGQNFDYKTSDSVCVWVFAPDNQLVQTTTFPTDGAYLLQVSAKGHQTEFDLEMAIQPFDRSEFPQATCGDPKPRYPAMYPVRFYPVNIPYSSKNLRRAKSLFCKDAYKKYREDLDDYVIQISSFRNIEKAQAFVQFVEQEISNAKISEPTILQEP